MSSKRSSGSAIGGVFGAIAILALTMVVIQAITALINALVNLLMVLAIIALVVGILGLVYWFVIRPNTVHGQRSIQLDALAHHEQVLGFYSRCNALEREIAINRDILSYQKERLRIELRRLQTDIDVSRLPITELEMRLRQVEVLFESMGGGHGDYTHEYTNYN